MAVSNIISLHLRRRRHSKHWRLPLHAELPLQIPNDMSVMHLDSAMGEPSNGYRGPWNMCGATGRSGHSGQTCPQVR